MRRRRIENARIAEVLSAAAAPPRPQEYAGEEAAVAAFHRERLSPTPAPAKSRFTLVKVAGFVLAGLSVGGVAFAANGILPGPPAAPPVPVSSKPASSQPGLSRTEGIVPERSTSPSRTRRPGPAEPEPRPMPTASDRATPRPAPRPTKTGEPRPWPMPTELPVPTELPLPIPLPTGMPTSMPTNFPDFPGE